MTTTLFLPGAGGSSGFWQPVADRLRTGQRQHLFSWPGLGNEPHVRGVRCLDDLVDLVLRDLDEPSNIVAQSMGGLVAVKAALAKPEKFLRLVLVATSGGIPVSDLGGSDWRAAYREAFPRALDWITEVREDVSAQLPSLTIPTLLIWGDSDSISPLAVGERLRGLLPSAKLVVIRGGGHDLAITHAPEVARLISEHLK